MVSPLVLSHCSGQFGVGAPSRNPNPLFHAFPKYGLMLMGPGPLGVLAGAAEERLLGPSRRSMYAFGNSWSLTLDT